jgi:negative regulator of sigma-B (phosphoserine phosphatase)
MRYGVVNRSKPGNEVSGDTYLFHESRDSTLVALIDGLGAGQAAHQAAARARECVSENACVALDEVLKRCHRVLRGTRGAVMMLMRVDRSREMVSFAGVGNIGVKVLSSAPIKPLSRNGIVGYRMESVREFSYPYTEGDVFILHSDGISTRFTVDEDWVRDPGTDLQQVAHEIADNFGKDDDVTVVVVR